MDQDQTVYPVDLDREQFEQARRDYIEHYPSARDTEVCHACEDLWPCSAHGRGETVLTQADVL